MAKDNEQQKRTGTSLEYQQERDAIEHRENMERDLTYAKSEIGTVATRFLKKSPLLRRAAGVVLTVAFSIGVGTTVGLQQIHPDRDSGFGVLEVDDEENSHNDTSEDTVDNAVDNDDDISIEELISSGAPVTLTEGDDGIYRWHSDAVPPQYKKNWSGKYVFEVPSELRAPEEPYVIHAHVHRHNDISTKMKKRVLLEVYSVLKNKQEFDLSLYKDIPNGEWESDDSDIYAPLFPENPHVDEEISLMSILQSYGVDVDIEIMPIAQAQLRTWDGQSKLEEKDDVLVRVTGPMTATTLTKRLGNSVKVYGYRKGDKSFTPLSESSELERDPEQPFEYVQTIELSGREFASGSTTLDGIELLWVSTAEMNKKTWWID